MNRLRYALIRGSKNSISYEHCVVQFLPPDIYIGDAERNYYLNRNQEINLCVHYNFRIPKKYAFSPIYRYYVTNGRQSLSLHRNLGAIRDEFVLEKYDSLEQAQSSPYYQDFLELKEQIDAEICRQKELQQNEAPLHKSTMSCSFSEKGSTQLRLYEVFLVQEQKYLQFHTDESHKKIKLSISRYRVNDLWRYLEDFYEIEPVELNILEYLPVENNAIAEEAPYHAEYQEMCRIRDLLDMPL